MDETGLKGAAGAVVAAGGTGATVEALADDEMALFEPGRSRFAPFRTGSSGPSAARLSYSRETSLKNPAIAFRSFADAGPPAGSRGPGGADESKAPVARSGRDSGRALEI